MKNRLMSMFVLVGAGACASGAPTEDEMEDWQYRRDTARIEAREEFEKLKQDCARSRGAVVVNRTFSRRMQQTPDDVELATCMPGTIGAVY